VSAYYIYIIVSFTLHINHIFIASLWRVWPRRVFISGNNVRVFDEKYELRFFPQVLPLEFHVSLTIGQTSRTRVFLWSAWYFSPILTSLLSRQILKEVPSKQFHENPCRGRRVCTCGKTDRTRRMVAFRKFAIAPQNIASENDLTILPNYSYHILSNNSAEDGIQLKITINSFPT
jgi:hypothetical protein